MASERETGSHGSLLDQFLNAIEGREMEDGSTVRNIGLAMRLLPSLTLADINESGAIHLAAEANSLELVNALIALGVNVKAQDEDLDTPLHIAADLVNKDMVDALIRAGADVRATNKSGGQTPLHMVSRQLPAMMQARWGSWQMILEDRDSGRLAIVNALLDHGADINAKDRYLETPLYYAANTDCLKVMQLLIDRGADVNAKNNRGLTAIHLLCGIANIWTTRVDQERGAGSGLGRI